jgi:crossover junction endodeoxyribonuclease RuvC
MPRKATSPAGVRILGIDPGSTRAGYGIIDFTRAHPAYLEAGILGVKTSDQHDRLVELFDSCNAMIKKWKPELLGIERLYFAKNAKTAMEVAQARGVLLMCARKHKLPIYEFTPMQVKQGLTGYGTADKKAIIAMVRRSLDVGDLNEPDDAFDALAIALVTGYSLRN